MTEEAKKAKKPAEHPTYAEMVKAALGALKERTGSSRQAILKYIEANFTVGENASVHLKMTLKRMTESGKILHTKGKGASGSFKLNKAVKEEKPKKKKPVKKPVAKKPAAKKTPAKKPAAKKPATKSPKKVAKKSTKKTGEDKKKAKKTAAKPKTPAKKPAAKKPAKKPAAKKGAKASAKKAPKSPKKK